MAKFSRNNVNEIDIDDDDYSGTEAAALFEAQWGLKALS